MAFFTLLVLARELSQKSSRFLWSHNLKPEKKHLKNDKIKSPFVPCRFLKKSKLGKRSKSPGNLIKPMEALVRNLPCFNLHMRCIPLFPVNLSILQPSGIHQSSVWSHPLRPPWDHSIPLGSRRPSPSGLITVYLNTNPNKARYEKENSLQTHHRFAEKVSSLTPWPMPTPPTTQERSRCEGVPNAQGKLKNAAWFMYIPKQFSCSFFRCCFEG